MTDEEIIAVRKEQVGRSIAVDVTKPYSDSIAFARALLNKSADEVDLLTARIAELEKDAARYRWLRDIGDQTCRPLTVRWGGISAEKCNEMIDAQIAKEQQ